jgi:iron complex transport system permease protein
VSITSRRARRPLTAARLTSIVLLLSFLTAAISLLGLSAGSVSIPFGEILPALTGSTSIDQSHVTIVRELRLPRVLLAMTVGAGLSLAGLVFQALLRNPLAEPYILGISSGGTLGAIAAIAASAGLLLVPISSLAGSFLVMIVVYLLSHRRGQLDTYTLLLTGVMVGAFFNAAVFLIVSLESQEFRPAFLWLMGNLTNGGGGLLGIVALSVGVAALPLFFLAKSFNLIATGEESAMQLGVEVRTVKKVAYALASVITGLVVSVSGVIGFVGLIIPHLARLLFGPDHRILLPSSCLLGASFLVLADTVARTALAPMEIPVGVVTAVIGAPVFIYFLKRG